MGKREGFLLSILGPLGQLTPPSPVLLGPREVEWLDKRYFRIIAVIIMPR